MRDEQVGGLGARLREHADAAAAAYLLAVLLAGVQALVLAEPGRTLRAAVPYLLGLLVVLVVRAIGPGDEVELTRWLRGLAVLGVLLAVWLLGAFLGALPMNLGEPSSFYRVKLAVTSPVGDHNTAAGLLLPAIVAAAAMAVRDARWRAGLVVLALGLVATLSRGAAVVLLLVGLVALVIASHRRFALWLLGAGVVSVGLILGLATVLDASPPGDVEVAEPGVLGASVLGRVDLAERGLRLGMGHPALGVGIGGFQDAAEGLPAPNDHAHQLLTHAFAEGGVALLLVAIVVPVVLARRALALPSGPARDVLLLAGGALVVHAQVEVLGGRVGYEVLLAALVGVAGALGSTAPGLRRAA